MRRSAGRHKGFEVIDVDHHARVGLGLLQAVDLFGHLEERRSREEAR
jgi:hypothetical protein